MKLKKKRGRYRWFIAFLLFLVTTNNYIDRQILGLLKPELEKVFHWTEEDYSHIVMVFTSCYAFGLLFYSRIIDRIGTKLGYSISVSIWSIAAMLHAFAKSTLGFSVFRGILGIGESGNYPAGVKAAKEWFPDKERALAIGFLDSGSNIGSAIGPIIVPLALGLFGWQFAFIFTGSLGFIWLIFWRIYYDKPGRTKRLSKEEYDYISTNNAESRRDSNDKLSFKQWINLLKLRQTWAFIVGKFFTDPIWFFFLFWLPSFFHDVFQFDLSKPNLPLVIVYSGTMVGSIGGGWLSSFFIKKGWQVYKARKFTLIISAFCVLPIVFTKYTHGIWIVIALLGVSVAANQSWSANIYSIVTDMFPAKAVGSVIGIGGMAGAIGSIIFPLAVGFILDYFKRIGHVEVGYNIIFLICSTSFLVAWILIHFITPKMNRAEI